MQVVRVLLFVLEFISVGLFTFSVFRLLQRRDLQIKVICITGTLGLLAYYLYDIVGMKSINIIFIPVFLAVACMILFSLSVFYSIIIALTFTVIGFISEYVMVSIAQIVGVTNFEEISTSFYQMSLIQLISSLVFILLAYYFSYRKFGFMFLANKMYGKKALTPLNIWLCITLLALVTAIEGTNVYFAKETSSLLHPLIFFIIAALLVIALIYFWKKQKHAHGARYTSTKGIKVIESKNDQQQ